MDIYCPGGKTWLICGPKEAKTIQYTLLGAAKPPPKGYIAKFGFLWAANQPGFSPQAVNIHHPTELLCFKFWLGMQPHNYLGETIARLNRSENLGFGVAQSENKNLTGCCEPGQLIELWNKQNNKNNCTSTGGRRPQPKLET